MLRYEHSTVKNATYKEIPDNSTFEHCGMGNVRLGRIGDNTTIEHSGMGNLFIDGEVSESAKFIITGMGNTYFAKKPPETVLKALDWTGFGNCFIPDCKPKRTSSTTPGVTCTLFSPQKNTHVKMKTPAKGTAVGVDNLVVDSGYNCEVTVTPTFSEFYYKRK